MHEWMHWQPVKGGRFASLLPTPARVLVAAGAALAVVAGLMPWAEGVAPGRTGFEPVFFSGLGGAGDGVMLIVMSLAAGILTIHRTPAESRTRTIRLIPAALVVLAIFSWLNGQRAAAAAVKEWAIRGGSGGPALGLWLAGIGVAAMAVGTAWLMVRVIRWDRRDDDPENLVAFSWTAAAEVVAAITGLMVGAVAGISLGIAISGPTLVGTIFLGAVFGGLLGGYAGSWIVTRTARRMAARSAARNGQSRPSGREGTPGR